MRFLLCVCTLSGCATQTQYRVPANVSQKDYQACRFEAMKVEASQFNPIIGMQYGAEAMQLCLRTKGY